VSEPGEGSQDLRLLLFAPTPVPPWLSSLISGVDVETAVCPSIDSLHESIEGGVAAILATEDAATRNQSALASILAGQPAWSDLPVLILANDEENPSRSVDALSTLGNVTLLQQPVNALTLASAVKTAFRARERQYQIRGLRDELARLEEAVRGADHYKDEFLATLGHELRNPLASILAGLELMRLARVSEPTALRAVAVIDRQVNHLVRLVDDLLEVSRITRGVIDIRKQSLDMRDVLKTAVESTDSAMRRSQVNLEVKIATTPLRVLGDSVRLTQVFVNLLNNAAKYSNAGGHVWVVASEANGEAVVSVKDDGIGIEQSRLPSVFDMFVQVDRSSRRTQGGLGIGLTLVRRLVALHGGTVEARSDGIGTGSEFIVRLPIVDEGRASLMTPKEQPLTVLPTRRILVVDDNRDAVESLGDLLQALGAVVAVAHNGFEALDLVESFDPDTVLLDIGMPAMDGYEVARRIRAEERHAGVLLIALTGWGQEEDRRRSRAAGFNHHLVKPPDLARLCTILDRRKTPRTVQDGSIGLGA